MLRRPPRPLLPLVVALLLAACGGGGGAPLTEPAGPGPTVGQKAADFALPDVNPDSPTYAALLGPAVRAGQASAWYFGHAT